MQLKLLIRQYSHILLITIIGLGFMLIGLILLEWQVNKRASELAVQTSYLYQHAFKVNGAAREATFAITKFRNANLSAALAPNSVDHTAYQKELSQSEDLIEKNLSIIEANFLGDMEKVREARELYRDWNEERTEFVKLIINESNAEARELLKTKVTPFYEALEQRLSYFVAFSAKKAVTFVEQSQQTSKLLLSELQILALAFALFMLVVGAATALQVLKSLHQRDELIRQANKNLLIAATVFQSHEGMFITDSKGTFLRVNKAFTRITGYSEEETLGKTPSLLKSGQHDKTFYQAMWESINDTGSWTGEIWNRRKSGEVYPEQLNITSVKDASGIVINYVATLTDITEKKENEGVIKENNHRLNTILDNLFAYVTLLDTNGIVREINKAPLERAGYLREDVIGQYFYDAPWWSYDEMIRTQLITAINAAKQGKTSRYDVTVKMGDELVPIDFLIAPIRDSSGQIVNLLPTAVDITDRKRLEDELKRQAHIDYLTGLSNRRHFKEQGETEMSRAIRYETPLSLLMLDIDFFKKINDTHGHQAGDTVLQALSKLCQETLRQIDIVGRIGGEEFAIILPETDSKEALEVAERLREVVANTEVTSPVGLPMHFNVSIGVTTLDDKCVNLDTLLNQADKALYEAKETGRNKVCVV